MPPKSTTQHGSQALPLHMVSHRRLASVGAVIVVDLGMCCIIDAIVVIASHLVCSA